MITPGEENTPAAALAPLVSVVTPVYNGEKYLAECIESVLAQTYENWQYTIVNNCSTDSSLEIAQRYARQDNRIRIHTNQTFLPLMPNWNHAVRQISGRSKYCKIVHADDWLFPECIAKMVQVAEAYPSTGLVGAYRLNENEVDLDGLPYPSSIVSGRHVCRSYLLDSLYLFGSPTSLLIRADLIRSRDKFYNESNIHADLEVCFELLQDTDFGFVHQVLTYTRRHNEAITSLTRRLNTYRIGYLEIFKKYGHVYLNEEEYKLRSKWVMRSYYRFLSQSLFELKSKEFWNYHRSELKRLGYPFSKSAMARALLLETLNLHETAIRIIQAARQRKKREAIQDIKQLTIPGSSNA